MTITPPARTSSTRPHRAARLAPIAAVLAVAVTGCGSDDPTATNAAATVGTSPRPVLADDVPARTAAYVEATLRPDGDAGAAVRQLRGLLGGVDRSGVLAERLDLGHGLLPKGVSLEDDVLPHLGDHAAAFLLGGPPVKVGERPGPTAVDGAIVAEVRDAGSLRRAAGSRGRTETVDGETIRVIGDRAVWVGDELTAVGTEAAVRAVVAAAASGAADLAGNDRFSGALAQVRATNPVGLAWVDLRQAPTLNAAADALRSHARDRIGRSARGRGAAGRSPLQGLLPEGARSALEGLAPKALLEGLEGGRPSGGGKGSTTGPGRASRGRPVLRLPARDATAAMALELRPGRLIVRSGGTGATGRADPKAAADAVAALPAGSWLAFGGGASRRPADATDQSPLALLTKVLGGSLPGGLRDALGDVESVAGGVQGDDLFATRAAAVLRAADGDAAKRLLDELGALVGGRTGLAAKPQTIEGASSGLVVGLPGLPLQLALGVDGDRLAIGLGAASVTRALDANERFSSDPAYARAKDLLGGTAPSFVLRPEPLTKIAGGLGEMLGALSGGPDGAGAGLGGLGALMGGHGGPTGGHEAPGGRGASGGGPTGGHAREAGEAGLGRVLRAAERVKLVTAARESTGSTTWRGTFVVEYQQAARP